MGRGENENASKETLKADGMAREEDIYYGKHGKSQLIAFVPCPLLLWARDSSRWSWPGTDLGSGGPGTWFKLSRGSPLGQRKEPWRSLGLTQSLVLLRSLVAAFLRSVLAPKADSEDIAKNIYCGKTRLLFA